MKNTEKTKPVINQKSSSENNLNEIKKVIFMALYWIIFNKLTWKRINYIFYLHLFFIKILSCYYFALFYYKKILLLSYCQLIKRKKSKPYCQFSVYCDGVSLFWNLIRKYYVLR
jgi:hypothetical protein